MSLVRETAHEPSTINPDFDAIRSIAERAETAASCKRAVLSSVNKIHFVSPSKWLADKASSSSALINGKIHIVPNPIDCNVFKPGVKRIARAQYGIDDKAFVVGCSSLDLSDPMKNMLKLVEGLKHFSTILAMPSLSLGLGASVLPYAIASTEGTATK